MHISPIFETNLGSSENDLSPIILFDPLILKSRTGTVLTLMPASLSR